MERTFEWTPGLCTVVIPAYNTQSWVASTIESALAQDYEPIEIVVVDDGSTDETVEVLQQFGDRIVLIRQANAGPARARNVGARRSQGEFIAFLDSDDLWQPSRLRVCIDRLQTTDADAVTTDAWIIEQDTLSNRRYYDTLEFPVGRAQLAAMVRRNFVFSSVVTRRNVFEAVDGFREVRSLSGSEDYDLWLRVMLAGYSFGLVPEPLAQYRVRSDNFTSNVAKQWATHLLVLESSLGELRQRNVHAEPNVYFEIAQNAFSQRRFADGLRSLAMGARHPALTFSQRFRSVASTLKRGAT